ncbi:MAG TPA: outer membrane protein transport protein [Gemmatimonadaceae bacterium]|jgi:long-chain fatty acid transport protein
MMTLHRVKRFVFASAVAVPSALSAQAFGLNEIGSCAIGRGFAVTGAPCQDASTIFWNPAAATRLTGWNAVAGVTAIALNATFKQDTTRRVFESDVPTEYVPHAFVNYHAANSKLAYGVGVYVPYGLTSQWPDNFPGKFSAKKASLATIYVQPNIAYQINSKWSVGGGPIWGHSTVELIQAVDLSEQVAGATPTTPPQPIFFANLGIAKGTEFARVRLKGSANAFGAQIGVAGQPTPQWSVGLRFLTPLEFKYDDADAVFTQVNTGLVIGGTLTPPILVGALVDTISALKAQFTSGALVPQKVRTRITHPAQIQGGAAYSGLKNWLLSGDVAWVGWKRFNELPVDFQGPAPDRVLFEDYNNTTSVRLGAEYTIPTDGWKIRAGFAGAASAAPDVTVTPLLPEQDRWYSTFGVEVPFGKMWKVEGAYAHVATPGARGRIVERTNRNQTAVQLNTGVYTVTANIVSITAKASF